MQAMVSLGDVVSMTSGGAEAIRTGGLRLWGRLMGARRSRHYSHRTEQTYYHWVHHSFAIHLLEDDCDIRTVQDADGLLVCIEPGWPGRMKPGQFPGNSDWVDDNSWTIGSYRETIIYCCVLEYYRLGIKWEK